MLQFDYFANVDESSESAELQENTGRERLQFDFSHIPDHLAGDGDGYGAPGYVDSDLTFLELELPFVSSSSPDSDDLSNDPPGLLTRRGTQRCDTIGEYNVAFAVSHWDGPYGYQIELWQREATLDDYCCAITRGDWYLVVGCSTGHPFVCTPEVDWMNSDGSTDELLEFGEEPMAIARFAVELAKGYIEHQQH